MDDILFEEQYKDLISPRNLFKNLEEVKRFCEGATTQDLIYFKDECDRDQLYEYSAYIRDLLKKKK